MPVYTIEDPAHKALLSEASGRLNLMKEQRDKAVEQAQEFIRRHGEAKEAWEEAIATIGKELGVELEPYGLQLDIGEYGQSPKQPIGIVVADITPESKQEPSGKKPAKKKAGGKR